MFRNPSVLSARLVACAAALALTGGAAAQITVPGDFPPSGRISIPIQN